jgi:hypothetical protein
MPALAALIFGLQLLCLAHVMRTGRPCQWVFIIMGLPLAGCVAYLVMEILPDLRHSRAARQAVRDIGAVIDPERDLREKAQRVAEADTVENRNPPPRAAAKNVDIGELGGVALGAWRSMRTRSTMPCWRCSA